MSSIFGNLVNNGLSIALIVSLFIGVFYLYGRLIISFVGISETAPATTFITAGMAIITFAAWYSYKVGIAVDSFITIACIVAAGLAFLNTMNYIKNYSAIRSMIGRPKPNGIYYIVPIIAICFSAQSIIAFKFVGQPIGRIGNNDIFSWALMADHFLGGANARNVIPGGSAFFESLQTDAWGTYYNLAMIAKISGLHALEATPIFVVMCLTLITLSIYEIIQRSFALSCLASLIVAILTGAGSFLFYIAFNGFYGQLLGTIFFLATILGILEINGSNIKHTWAVSLVVFSLPFVGLLLGKL